MTKDKTNEDDLEMDKSEEIEESEEVKESNGDESEIDKVREELGEKEKEIEDLTDQLLRLQADFMNFKRRSEKSKQDTIAYAVESFVSDILPIIDNFERALESNDDKENPFLEGVVLIYTELKKVLEKNNVTEIQALNTEFDPNLHHAVFMEESEDHDANMVIEVLQKGYKMKDRVVRPTMVKVSK